MSQRYSGGLITTNTNINNSIFFNGSSTWLTFAGASQYAIANSTTPFTVECWIKPIGSGGVILSEGFTGTGNTLSLVCSLATSNTVENTAGNFPAFGWFNGSAWVTAAASTTAIVLNVWSHVAFVFTGSTSRIYINGIDVTKPSLPTPATTWGVTGVNGDGWYIGRAWTGGGNTPNANISNLRFVNGTAVYTANFAPPYTLAPITNTALLTCQPYNFVGNLFDNSSYNATITIVGPITAVRDNPFGIFSPRYNPALGAATPGVWELNEAAAAAAQRSWNMYDPFFNLNTGMVHGNGTNGGTNNTFLDSSTNNFTITRNGNTTQGTFTPFKSGWSTFFNGTSDSLTVPAGTDFAYGTGDFTVEGWFYATSTLAAFGSMLWSQVAPGHNYFYVAAGEGASPVVNNYIQFVGAASGGGTPIYSSTVFTLNTWNHFAVVRISGLVRVYLNGVGGTATSNTTNFNNTTYVPNIARYTGGTSWFPGYISNLRVVKGVGVYTGNFTVPTEPLTATQSARTNIAAITSGQTVFLGLQSNRFVDNSSTPKTISINGTPRILSFSPLYPPTAYLPQNNGGAMFFDGAGDYLTVTGNSNLALGTGNFTIEFFIFLTTTTAFQFLYDATPSGASGAYPMIYMATGPVIIFATVDVDRIVSNSTIVRYQWNHVAVSRVSGTTRMFINGVQQTQTYTDSNNYINGTNRPLVGFGGQIAGNPFNGFISDLRVLKGAGVTSVTVPTAPLTPITNTQLLLSGTNASFIDNAANLTIETVNASISTAQSKYGSGSMLFNGTSAYANVITPFGNGGNVVNTLGDFTIEGWVNPITVNAQRTMFYINGNNNSYAAVRLDHTSTGAVQILVSFNGTGWTINTTTSSLLVNGTWTHLAVVRIGPNITVYYNGVAITTSAAISATTALMTGTNSVLGALFSTTYGGYFNGYISDFRTTNYARYQGNFTPPTSTLQNQ